LQRHPRSTLFPYTTLFRSGRLDDLAAERVTLDPGLLPLDRLGDVALLGAVARGAAIPPVGVLEIERRTADPDHFAQLHAHRAKRSEEHTSELQSRENLVCR